MLCQVEAEPLEATTSPTSAVVSWTTARRELSTGCTECCGNVDYSTFANCGIFGFGPLAPGPKRSYIPSCAEHGAGVGRSSTGRPYGAARKSRSGKSVGAVDETATDSATLFGPPHAAAPRLPARLGSPRCTRPVRRASTRA